MLVRGWASGRSGASRRGARGGPFALAALLVLVTAACGDGDVLRHTAGRAGKVVSAPTSSTTPSAASMPTAPPSTTVAPSTTAAPRRVSLVFAGDAMAHEAVIRSGSRFGDAAGAAYDFDPIWQLTAPVLSRADLAVCHLETTIGSDGAAPTGYPRFRAPVEYVTALARAGFDTCSTASNHSNDYGTEGIELTIAALQQSGLGWAGTARSEEEGAGATMYAAAGVRIAHLSATYGLNGLPLPDDQPWMVDLIDIDRLLADAAAARAAGAEIVIVSLHCCVEYRVEPTDAQVEMVRQLLASSDIDLVVGHHAHVVQPIERIGDKWALYGLGNILSNMYESRCCPAASQDGVIVEVEFVEQPGGRFGAGRVGYVPTWVDRANGHVVTPVAPALADPELDATRRAALEASMARTLGAINSRGADTAGAVMSG